MNDPFVCYLSEQNSVWWSSLRLTGCSKCPFLSFLFFFMSHFQPVLNSLRPCQHVLGLIKKGVARWWKTELHWSLYKQVVVCMFMVLRMKSPNNSFGSQDHLRNTSTDLLQSQAVVFFFPHVSRDFIIMECLQKRLHKRLWEHTLKY